MGVVMGVSKGKKERGKAMFLNQNVEESEGDILENRQSC